MSFSSKYLFVSCQPGSEKILKEELGRNLPKLRPAFMRPGFVTFKSATEALFFSDFQLPSIFARAYGISLGNFRSSDPIGEVFSYFQEFRSHHSGRFRLHVWERPREVREGESDEGACTQAAETLESRIREQFPDLFMEGSQAERGDLVLNVVLLESEEGWPIFVGLHQASTMQSFFPGGAIPVDIPQAAPSRAFAKIEQGIRWSGIPVKSRDRALELGSAPGGAAYSLLLRGLEVWGIDPGAMDPTLWLDPKCEKRFHHIKKAYSGLVPEDLPESIDWLVLDINAPARISLSYVEELSKRFKGSLLGLILTLKINDPSHAQFIPEWIERVRGMGGVRVRATQLSSNRQEICVVALTSKGQLRLQSESSAI